MGGYFPVSHIDQLTIVSRGVVFLELPGWGFQIGLSMSKYGGDEEIDQDDPSRNLMGMHLHNFFIRTIKLHLMLGCTKFWSRFLKIPIQPLLQVYIRLPSVQWKYHEILCKFPCSNVGLFKIYRKIFLNTWASMFLSNLIE